MPRTIVIGDVHGCADEFAALLADLDASPDDRVLQLGDLVNHGPDPCGVIALARKHGVEAILGNHELRLLRSRREKRRSFLKPYDLPTLQRLGDSEWAFLEALPKFKYLPDHDAVCIHGGFLPGIPWQNQAIEVTSTIQVIDKNGRPAKRSDAPSAPPWADFWTGPPFVFYGHTPRQDVLRRPTSLGIDTGCVYGGRLTAYILEEDRLVQVSARRSYARSRFFPFISGS